MCYQDTLEVKLTNPQLRYSGEEFRSGCFFNVSHKTEKLNEEGTL